MENGRQEIQQQLEGGKINADQAEELLSALETMDADQPARWFRIYVTDKEEGEVIRMKLPLAFVRTTLRIFNAFPFQVIGIHKVDQEIFKKAVLEGRRGEVVVFEDEEDKIDIIID